VRPLLLARKEKPARFRHVWIYVLERLFDLASAARDAAIGLLLFKSNADSSGAATRLKLQPERRVCFFCWGGWSHRFSRLPAAARHGSFWNEGLQRMAERATDGALASQGKLLGFARGVADDTEREGFDVVDRLLRGHCFWCCWFYLGFRIVSVGPLGKINIGDGIW